MGTAIDRMEWMTFTYFPPRKDSVKQIHITRQMAVLLVCTLWKRMLGWVLSACRRREGWTHLDGSKKAELQRANFGGTAASLACPTYFNALGEGRLQASARSCLVILLLGYDMAFVAPQQQSGINLSCRMWYVAGGFIQMALPQATYFRFTLSPAITLKWRTVRRGSFPVFSSWIWIFSSSSDHHQFIQLLMCFRLWMLARL